MLGADGVLMGTRFYASKEAAGLAAAKERIVRGKGDQPVRGILFDIVRGNVWPAPYTGRLLRDEFFENGVAARPNCFNSSMKNPQSFPKRVRKVTLILLVLLPGKQ
jgi:NAD(P)H-dependent flavin oxidoreductase YrpB (nitropropane dioxygenase family)